MTTAYIYGEQRDSAAEIISWAKSQQCLVVLITIGHPSDEMMNLGADRAVAMLGDIERPESYATSMAELIGEDADAIFAAPSSVAGREIAAFISGSLSYPMVSDISSASLENGAIRAERTVLGGAVVDTVEASLPCVVTTAAGFFDPQESATVTTVVDERAVQADHRVVRRSVKPFSQGDVDLTKAPVVVCVGMGVDGEDDIAMAQKLASDLGGAVGCTRDVSEGRKLLPKDRYIGITGAIVKPALYLSMGVSGQLQHVYGIRDAKVIVAVDTNKDAPIFRAADYGIVGDLHEVIPQIIEAIEAR